MTLSKVNRDPPGGILALVKAVHHLGIAFEQKVIAATQLGDLYRRTWDETWR